MNNQKCQNLGSQSGIERQESSLIIRKQAAKIAFDRGVIPHVCNGEEQEYRDENGYPNFSANFSK